MKKIINKTFDAERALYGSNQISLESCCFDGPADGESALKESSDISVIRCLFNLRYPFWHDHNLTVASSEMTSLCRAALWYSENISVSDTKLHGIKALRECKNVTISGCDIASPEFGWSVSNISMTDSSAISEYFMLRSDHLTFKNVSLNGKYSFQYITDSVFDNCRFDTKDAFWHSKNTIVRNSIINGEYLAWYSENLTLENCRISGTQPFCYCKHLTLINCVMQNADLAFEKSDVTAEITTPVLSIKNPRSGRITVPSVGTIIRDDPDACGEIIVTGK